MANEGVMVWNNASLAVNQMTVADISSSYVKYIGAGMMLCGGIIGAIKLIPTIIVSIKETLNARKENNGDDNGSSSEMLILIGGVVVGLVAAYLISQSITMAIVAIIVSFIFIISEAF